MVVVVLAGLVFVVVLVGVGREEEGGGEEIDFSLNLTTPHQTGGEQAQQPQPPKAPAAPQPQPPQSKPRPRPMPPDQTRFQEPRPMPPEPPLPKQPQPQPVQQRLPTDLPGTEAAREPNSSTEADAQQNEEHLLTSTPSSRASFPILPHLAPVRDEATRKESFGIYKVDHAVGNVPDLFESYSRIKKFTGFHEFAEFTTEDVGTLNSGLNSVVLASDSEAVLMPLNEPTEGK